MKKMFCLLLVLFIAVTAFAGCAAKKTSVNVKFVVDNGYDGTIDETIYEGTVEIEGKDPSVATILDQLNGNQITVVYNEDLTVKSIENKENKTEDENGKTKISQWYVSVGEDKDIEGLWSEKIVANGDTVVFKYAVWVSKETK